MGAGDGKRRGQVSVDEPDALFFFLVPRGHLLGRCRLRVRLTLGNAV